MHNFCLRLCNCLCLCLCHVFVIVFVFVRETIGKELSLALSEAFAAPLLRTSPLRHPSDSRLISQGEKVNTNSKSFLPRHTHARRYKHTQFGNHGIIFPPMLLQVGNWTKLVDFFFASGILDHRSQGLFVNSSTKARLVIGRDRVAPTYYSMRTIFLCVLLHQQSEKKNPPYSLFFRP